MKNGIYAVIYTQKGTITIQLHYEKTPATVGNFKTSFLVLLYYWSPRHWETSIRFAAAAAAAGAAAAAALPASPWALAGRTGLRHSRLTFGNGY